MMQTVRMMMKNKSPDYDVKSTDADDDSVKIWKELKKYVICYGIYLKVLQIGPMFKHWIILKQEK